MTSGQTIDRIERHTWQLALPALIVILFLTVTLLGVQSLGFFGKMENLAGSEGGYKYSMSLSILVLLFCAYFVIQQRKLLHLSKSYLEKREAYISGQNVSSLTALLEVSSLINSRQELPDILDTIVKEIFSCFGADQSSIMLLEAGSNMLQTKAVFGKGAEFVRGAQMPVGEGIAGCVVKSGRPLLLNGKVNPADFPGTPRKNRGISSAMIVPLTVSEKGIGVLNVNLIESERTFTDSELKLTTIFANNAAIAINNARLLKERERHIRLQTMFEQLHSPQVAQKLIRTIDESGQASHMREKLVMTILFADIRGFTNMMAHLELEEIMDFLDEFYSLMTRTVFDNEGSIDKFMGDEVMAFFGAPIPLQNSCDNGVRTAMEMVTAFRGLREKFSRRSSHFEKLGIGLGVNVGKVFVGSVGSETRYDYTVIGTAVNLARRLCSHAEPGQILVAESILGRITDTAPSKFVGKISFKGIPEPVNVHRIVGVKQG